MSSVFAKLNSSKTKREFINSHKISRHLHCAICHDVFQDPVRTACGHTFCYICIENWALVQKRCPLCKVSVRTRKLEKDLIALNIIDDLLSRCIHPGCGWQGVYSILKKHQRWCEFKPKRDVQLPTDQIFEVQKLASEEDIEKMDVISVQDSPEQPQ